MKILFIVFIFFLISTSLSSQNFEQNYISSGYYKKIYEADSLFLEKNYKDSFKILDKVFSKFEPVQLQNYQEYTTFVKLAFILGKKKKFINGVKELVKKYGYTEEQLLKDDILSNIFDMTEIDLKILREEFLSNSSIALKDLILEMKNNDQINRGSFGIYQNNKKKQDSLDKKNALTLMSIFESKGYPNFTKLGLNPMVASIEYDITSILLHINDSLRDNYFLPKIYSFVKQGKCDPQVYAGMYDKLQINSGKKQKYYTFLKSSNKIEIKNFGIEALDNERESIGLSRYHYTLWKLTKRFGENSSLVKKIKNLYN